MANLTSTSRYDEHNRGIYFYKIDADLEKWEKMEVDE
jgi:hypothetical protein